MSRSIRRYRIWIRARPRTFGQIANVANMPIEGMGWCKYWTQPGRSVQHHSHGASQQRACARGLCTGTITHRLVTGAYTVTVNILDESGAVIPGNWTGTLVWSGGGAESSVSPRSSRGNVTVTTFITTQLSDAVVQSLYADHCAYPLVIVRGLEPVLQERRDAYADGD